MMFKVNQTILVANVGKMTPSASTRYVTLYDSATQSVIGQTQVPGQSNEYHYAPLPLPVMLVPGHKYVMEVSIPAGDQYFVYTLGTMPNLASPITYIKGMFCNTCGVSTYPNLADPTFFSGFPDFQYYKIPTLNPEPGFSIGVDGQGTQITLGAIANICTGTTTALLPYSATVGNPGQYSIQWGASALSAGFVNVSNITLPASPIHITVPATASGYFDGTFSVPGTCAASSSYYFGLTVIPLGGPSVSISGTNTVSTGTQVTYTATTNGTSPIYQWKVNNTNVGTNSNTYTYTPLNGDKVKCFVTVTAAGCMVIDTGTSNTINMAVFPLSVSSTSTTTELKVYPNPVNDILNIDLLKETMSYRLHNIIGSTVLQGTLHVGSDNIPVHNIPTGIYILELVNAKGEKSVVRVVKD